MIIITDSPSSIKTQNNKGKFKIEKSSDVFLKSRKLYRGTTYWTKRVS